MYLRSRYFLVPTKSNVQIFIFALITNLHLQSIKNKRNLCCTHFLCCEVGFCPVDSCACEAAAEAEELGFKPMTKDIYVRLVEDTRPDDNSI